MLNPIPWYKSPQMIAMVTSAVSAIIALFPKIGTMLGLTSATQVSDAITNIFSAIAIFAPIVASVLRARSTIQPLTLTQAKATAGITESTQASQEIHDANVIAASNNSPPIVPVPKSDVENAKLDVKQ